MKTIDEEADLYESEFDESLTEEQSDNLSASDNFRIGFKYGVEFAEMWIPVEEELPELRKDPIKRLTDVVICKNKTFAYEFSGYYDTELKVWKLYPTGSRTIVTHWRPINHK